MFIALAITLLLIGLFGLLTSVYTISKAKDYKVLYDEALANGDKATALAAGRKYYGALRGTGRTTAADEQAITNDLLTMRK